MKKKAQRQADNLRSRYVNNHVRVTESNNSQSISPSQFTAAYLRKDAIKEIS